MLKQFHRACLSLSLLAAAAVALSACAPQTDQPPAEPLFVAPVAPQVGQTGDAPPLTFFDSDAFDSTLATALSSGQKDVHITFAGTTSVNQMPPRINAWLAEVKRAMVRSLPRIQQAPAPVPAASSA